MTQKQASRRPRVLTVNRRNATAIQLRVLRRFTWTEADPFAQYEKLLSAYSVADWSEEYFNNHALFSDYYLKERLPDEPQWREQSKPAYVILKGLYRGASGRFAQADLPTLLQQLFEPVLVHLGLALTRPHSRGAEPQMPPRFLLEQPGGGPTLATCLAYRWNRNLDGKDDKDPENPAENPSASVVSLLEQGQSRWAVVTNGKLWRLYSAEAHSRATNYYEIDLQEILAETGQAASSPGDAFPFFWLLFRRDAFVERESDWQGARITLSFLDRLLRESQQYARVFGENLKRRVFEEIFPHLAQGFITDIRMREGAQAEFSEERLVTILQSALNHPSVQRSPAIGAIRFLSQPMLSVQIRALREAYREFQTTTQVAGLLEHVAEMEARFGSQTSETTAPAINGAAKLKREDLNLICFDFISS